MSARILGLGTAKPEFQMTQNEAFEHAQQYCGGTEKQKRALKHLYDRTTIQTRGTVLPQEALFSSQSGGGEFFPMPNSGDDFGPTTAERMLRYEQEVAELAFKACEAALSDALAIDPSTNVASYHSLVTVSCTGFYSPGFDIELINRLGLNRDISRTHIGYMGCHGAMNGLRVADALHSSKSREGRVLLCAAEICSLHFHYGWNSDNLLANSLFADGAAAMVLGESARTSGGNDGCEAVDNPVDGWRIHGSASYVVPNSLGAMSWKIRDNGFVMTLSAAVPDLIEAHLQVWLQGWLNSLNLRIEDIGAWAIHPGGAKILDAVGNSLGLSSFDLSFSRDVLQLSGNMSSPTVMFILEKIRLNHGCVPTVMLAFGPGLTIEAAYLAPA